MNGAHLLLGNVFDFAGLFPPAGLALDEVVRQFAGHRRGATAWMLGRLVVPVGQLDDLDALVRTHPPEDFTRPWGLSVLGSGSIEDDRDTLSRFTTRQRGDGRLAVESVELRVVTRLDVRRARTLARDGWEVYLERVDPSVPLDEILDAIAVSGMRAKLRAGGVQPEQIPPAAEVARLLAGCVQRGISLKATAGLHHALTGTYPLTYEADSAVAPMHGYLNLLVAAGVAQAAGAAAVRAPEVIDAITRILQLGSKPVFSVGGILEWSDRDGPRTEGPLHELAPSARALVRGIGSCSFDEPVRDAHTLGLA